MDMRVFLFVIILMFSFDAMAEPPDDLKAHLWSDRVLILAAELAKTWDVSEPFTLILVGKDGTEKLRSHKAVAVEMLFETIDAMPMRIREMKSDP
ncbi:DUF4174 domain-containing protein [Microvenator marinus]|uniref:DUF4174 domain-containing protein n=1 Tax=Microvenator marinus TaxID=2600177 RepID=A0A5B8XR61_9DELT|nr:DUF4174 domain-containing protein [Microvenator marinus]QED28004.1 DUF4174 domain-containing protein [Microvenator marinus]